MARTETSTPFYIRTSGGDCFHVETLAEALEEFLGDNGYRLSIRAGEKELVIRRTSPWDETLLGETEGTAKLTCRDRR